MNQPLLRVAIGLLLLILLSLWIVLYQLIKQHGPRLLPWMTWSAASRMSGFSRCAKSREYLDNKGEFLCISIGFVASAGVYSF